MHSQVDRTVPFQTTAWAGWWWCCLRSVWRAATNGDGPERRWPRQIIAKTSSKCQSLQKLHGEKNAHLSCVNSEQRIIRRSSLKYGCYIPDKPSPKRPNVRNGWHNIRTLGDGDVQTYLGKIGPPWYRSETKEAILVLEASSCFDWPQLDDRVLPERFHFESCC